MKPFLKRACSFYLNTWPMPPFMLALWITLLYVFQGTIIGDNPSKGRGFVLITTSLVLELGWAVSFFGHIAHRAWGKALCSFAMFFVFLFVLFISHPK